MKKIAVIGRGLFMFANVENSSLEYYDLIVVGGGAAGFYGAVQAAEKGSGLRIAILEKSNKVLAKVKISGGGRCNVTHDCFDPFKLARHYPRGEKFLKTIFKHHAVKDTLEWFAAKGVAIKKEEDGRMFPDTDNSQTIIDCLMQQALRHAIKIKMGEGVVKAEKNEEGFVLTTTTGKRYTTSRLLVATGGNPNMSSYDWITRLGHRIQKPIPSLFTFNDKHQDFKDLMGLSVPSAEVRIAGTKYSQEGPVLITHWGLSGPAVIKLSSWSAEYLHEQNYQFTALVSWLGHVKEADVQKSLSSFKIEKGKQKITTNPQFGLPSRLWVRLCTLAQIEENKIWAELSQKSSNRLMEFLIRCPFEIQGKTTFKDEFVTCGGVDLKEVDLDRMESRRVRNLFFAGEVLNIDGETGGFNFQAAWSTAFTAAQAIAQS